MLKPGWVLIEHEGVLYRGPGRGVPQEFWRYRERRWEPYGDAGVIKPVDWGSKITEVEFAEWCAEEEARLGV